MDQKNDFDEYAELTYDEERFVEPPLTQEEYTYARQFSELEDIADTGETYAQGVPSVQAVFRALGEAAQTCASTYVGREPEYRLRVISGLVRPLADTIALCRRLNERRANLGVGEDHSVYLLVDIEYRVRSSLKFVADEFQRVSVEILVADSAVKGLVRRDMRALEKEIPQVVSDRALAQELAEREREGAEAYARRYGMTAPPRGPYEPRPRSRSAERPVETADDQQPAEGEEVDVDAVLDQLSAQVLGEDGFDFAADGGSAQDLDKVSGI